MYKQTLVFERELKFTETYRQHQHDNKSIREKCVLEQQISNYFLEPRDGDILAGRIDRPMITFSPCMEGDGIEKVGYGIDEAACLKALKQIEQDAAYSKEYIESVCEMISFWQCENTNTKIRRRIPAEYLHVLHTDDFISTPAVVHPLYRIAGLNLDFKKLYRYGLSGLMELLSEKSAKTKDVNKKVLYRSMSDILNALKGVLRQYADVVEDQLLLCNNNNRRLELEKIKNSLVYLQDNPPSNFQEALQLQLIYMLSGRSVELGRIDDYMSSIYMKSIKKGTVTREEALRLLYNFFAIIEEERGRDTRAIIGGYGRENEAEADEFALLVLDVLELRQFRFYPQVSLRYYKGMNEQVYNKSLELLERGYTFPLLYNDDVNVPSVMRAMDVPRKLAEKYSFFGCGEYIIAENSVGTPNSTLNIAKVVELALYNGKDPKTGAQWGLQTGEFNNETTFDEYIGMVKKQIDYFCDASGMIQELIYDVCNEECSFLLISILQNDCIELGKGILDGGIHHLGGTVETYGNITAFDSLTAIKELVYEKKKITQEKLLEVLGANFQGFEEEHILMKNASKFGNDDNSADSIAVEMHEYLCNSIRRQRERTRLDSFLVVIINNNMNILLGKYVGATPDGREDGQYLSNGNSAYTGCDRQGLPSLIYSMSKLDTSIHAGGNQNIKVSPEFFKNELQGIKSIVASFFDLGGQQLNLSVINQKDLEDALIHPENHENLVVRVGGFSARFIHLDSATQQDVLNRTAY